MQDKYLHSVRLNKDVCDGCVTCIKYCPTEAIRIRNGKAVINELRCIDCGECIVSCSKKAKYAYTNTLKELDNYKFNVALPAPTLYAQFGLEIALEEILAGLKKIGFDDVYEVSLAAAHVSLEIEEYVKNAPAEVKPLLSSTCPAVIRLIQVKFPELIKHILPILPPAEVAATEARKKFSQSTGLKPEEIGIWLISPCPAKVTNVLQPVDVVHTDINGAIGIAEIYGQLHRVLGSVNKEDIKESNITSYGLGWGYAGGEIRATGLANSLIVHNIKDVVEVLEQIDMQKMIDVDYIECLACSGGCIGGALTVENRFVAEKNLKLRIRYMRDKEGKKRKDILKGLGEKIYSDSVTRYKNIESRPIMHLDEDIIVAMQKLAQIEQILERLPKKDCGACGSPTCATFAEDIVQGLASETSCVFRMRSLKSGG